MTAAEQKHNVRHHRTATKRLRNPVIGEIALTGDAMELPGDGLTVIIYTAEPTSAAQQQLAFLASWSTAPAGTATAAREEQRSDDRAR